LTASVANVGCTTTCVDGYCNNYCYTYGYYYDIPVSGLSYESSAKAGVQTGVTGEESDPGAGSFRYVDGDTLPDDQTAFRRVSNLAVLLQSLDTDGDATNGIDISADVAGLFSGVNIDLSQAWEAFQADTGLQTVLDNAKSSGLLPTTRVLRDRVEALRALYQGTSLCP